MGPKKRASNKQTECDICKKELEDGEVCLCTRDDNDQVNSDAEESDQGISDTEVCDTATEKQPGDQVDEDTMEQLLIAEVRGYPAIWDPKVAIVQKGPHAIAKIWQKIDNALGVTSGCSKKRWRSLRDGYKRRLNDVKKKNPSGSAAEDCFEEISWPYFRSLDFLRPTVDNYRKSVTNRSLERPDNSGNLGPSTSRGSMQSDSGSALHVNSSAGHDTPQAKKRRRTSISSETSGLGASILEAINRPINIPLPPPLQPPPSMDMIDSFNSFLGCMLRNLGPDYRMELMHKILKEAMMYSEKQKEDKKKELNE